MSENLYYFAERLLYSATPSNPTYLHPEAPRRDSPVLDQPNRARRRGADGDGEDHASVDEEALLEEACNTTS